MKTYNGHRSWNAWNVALWMGNDEPLYRFAMDCIERARKTNPKRLAARASRYFMGGMAESKTPDGAKYTYLAVKLALEGFLSD